MSNHKERAHNCKLKELKTFLQLVIKKKKLVLYNRFIFEVLNYNLTLTSSYSFKL